MQNLKPLANAEYPAWGWLSATIDSIIPDHPNLLPGPQQSFLWLADDEKLKNNTG